MKALIIAALGIWPMMLPAAPAPVSYVATNGSDITGDGSAAKPWATLGAAAEKAPDGSTVIVRDGVYTTPSYIKRQFSNFVVFRAEHPYKAVLKASGAVTLYIYNGAYMEFTNFEITRGDPGSTYPLAIHIERSRNIILRDNIIHDSYSNDLMKVNTSAREILIIGNVFYNAYGPEGQHIDVNGCAGVYIRDNIFFADYEGSGQTDAKDGAGFIVVKNSADEPESRRTRITNNIFLHFQGGPGKTFVLFGEDGRPVYEAQDAIVENNLMLGNNVDQMRSAFGVKGAKDIIFRNNTVAGDLPSNSFAMRLNDEGQNPPNQNIQFYNNIWSDPTGTMSWLVEADPAQNTGITLRNNIYWNAGKAIPAQAAIVNFASDGAGLMADPKLADQADLVLPRWNGSSFLSGLATVRQEFERLARIYGSPGTDSAVLGKAEAANAPATDILDRTRSLQPDPGATEALATAVPVRVVAVPDQIAGGAMTALNQIILERPAEGLCGSAIKLTTSAPDVVSVPALVHVAPGSTSASFPATTATVNTPTPVTLTASYKSGCDAAPVTKSAVLTVMPERVTLNLSVLSITAGMSFGRNRILIEGVAPKEGLTVSLTSDRPEVRVPETILIPAGSSVSDYFNIDTGFVGERTDVSITASLSGATAGTGTLTLLPPKYALNLVTNSTTEGEIVKGNRVLLDEVAPAGGGIVKLVSANPGMLSVPASVTVPAGSNVATFTMVALGVNKRTGVTITATYNGRNVTNFCDVSPNRLWKLAPEFWDIKATGTRKVTVWTISPVLMDTVVALSQDESNFLRLPTSVTIPAGANSAAYTVSAPDTADRVTVTLYATYKGSTLNIALPVNPVGLLSIWTAGSLRPGNNTIRVYLDMVAPAGGKYVKLSSSDPAVLSVPETIFIPEGQKGVDVTATAAAATTPMQVTVTAALGTSSLIKALDIQP